MAGAAVSVALLIFATYFLVLVVIPVGAVALLWFGYRTYQELPSVIERRSRNRAQALLDSIKANQLPPDESFSLTVWQGLIADGQFPSFGIAICMFGMADALYEAEGFNRIPEPIPRECSPIDLGRQLDQLSALAAKVANPDNATLMRDTCIKSLRHFCSQLPPLAFQSEEKLGESAEANELLATYTTPLRSILPATGEAVQALVLPFYNERVISSGLFKELRQQLDRNIHAMSNVPYTLEHFESPNLISPAKSTESPDRIINGYLRGTPLETLFDAPVPVEIPDELRLEGFWVLAPQGRGKTTLLSSLIKTDFDKVRHGQLSLILMDSKGDLIDHARQLKEFGPGGDLEGKLVLIEPTPDFALNPLDLGATEGHRLSLTTYLLDTLLDTKTTPKQGSVLRRALLGVQAIPDASFTTLIDFLQDWHPFEEHLHRLPPADRDYFLDGKFDEFKSTREELFWRIDGLMTEIPLVRSMLRAPRTRLDIGKEMDAGNVIIIDNSKAKLAGGVEFYSRFFIALVLAAAEQRAGREQEDKLPCHFYIDECQTAIANEPKMAEVIFTCRSQKIGMVLAHQVLEQIKSADVQAALRNCAIRMVNVDNDAPALAERMRVPKETLRALKRGQFALYMNDLTPQALTIDVPNKPVSGWDKMSEEELAAIRADMKARYGYTPPDKSPETTPPPAYLGDEIPALQPWKK